MAQDKRVAIYPGTFDPLTNGHANIIRRGLRMFDNIIVAVAADTGKSPLFSLEERVAMAEKVFAKEPNISVEPFQGLLVEYVARRNVHTVLRGLRAVSDFEYEFQIALMNRKLRPDIETLFLISDYRWAVYQFNHRQDRRKFGRRCARACPGPCSQLLARALRIHARRDRTRIAAARTGTLGTCALTGTGSVTRQGY